MNQKQHGKLFVIAAPSGAGKTSLVTHALERIKKETPLKRIITYTTRHPRAGEVSGVDYFFLSHDDFEKKKADGFFLETTSYDGKSYGSPQSIVDDLALGASYVIITDRVGAKTLHQAYPDSVLIWITPPSIEILRQRLMKRGESNPQHIERRVALAHEEMEEEHKHGGRVFKYHLVNDNFEHALESLIAIFQDEISASQK